MPFGIEPMYTSNLVQEIVTHVTENRLTYAFATRDEAEGFLIKLNKEPRQTRAGTVTVSLLESDLEAREVTILVTTSQTRGLRVDRRADAPRIGGEPQFEVTEAEHLRKALFDLEDANNVLASGRSQEAYDAMIASGQQDALLALDEARRNARALLGT